MEVFIFSFNQVNKNVPYVTNENSEDISKWILPSFLWLKIVIKSSHMKVGT